MWNDENAIYDEGEWITWTEINSHLERLEFEHRFPHLDVDLVPIFQNLLAVAQDYHHLTGRHLQVYGDLGELYGTIAHGRWCNFTSGNSFGVWSLSPCRGMAPARAVRSGIPWS